VHAGRACQRDGRWSKEKKEEASSRRRYRVTNNHEIREKTRKADDWEKRSQKREKRKEKARRTFLGKKRGENNRG